MYEGFDKDIKRFKRVSVATFVFSVAVILASMAALLNQLSQL